MRMAAPRFTKITPGALVGVFCTCLFGLVPSHAKDGSSGAVVTSMKPAPSTPAPSGGKLPGGIIIISSKSGSATTTGGKVPTGGIIDLTKTGAGTLTLGGSGAGTLTLGGSSTSSGGVIVSSGNGSAGAGTLTLSGSNSYTGSTVILNAPISGATTTTFSGGTLTLGTGVTATGLNLLTAGTLTTSTTINQGGTSIITPDTTLAAINTGTLSADPSLTLNSASGSSQMGTVLTHSQLPEPSTAVLLSFGLVLVQRRRRA